MSQSLVAACRRRFRGVRARAGAEGGYTMVAVMGALLIVTMFSIAAFAAANADVPISRVDQNEKQAYSAAEAGVSDYLYHLNQDNTYWSSCTNVGTPNAVNDSWNGTPPDTRTRWRNVPGTTGAKYAIELLTVAPYTKCTDAAPETTMIDPLSNTFHIRVTGQSRFTKRSIIGVFRRVGFLDYIYFTDFETGDPTWYSIWANNQTTKQCLASQTVPNCTGPDLTTWASANCLTYYRNGRGNQTFNGQILDSSTGTWSSFNLGCVEINFFNGDTIAGPLHTNDSMLVCGVPIFGRTAQDQIQISDGDPGWRGNGGCSNNNPTFTGTKATNSPVVSLPPSDSDLQTLTQPSYTFTGKTTIALTGTSMTVTNANLNAGVATSMALPSNGLVYVKSGVCGASYNPLNPDGDPVGCGDAYVSGTYAKNITIGTEKDIITTGNIIGTGDTLLGLIANNFVRVAHPVSGRDPKNPDTCTNAAGTNVDIEIDAAILALNHSFAVDNWYCGAALNKLTVKGAIAQKFRGIVGQNASTGRNGYIKAYSYDDRLRYRSPPHFLDPVQSAWRIVRYSEQIPAR